MWKVTIAGELCHGYACCVMALPSVFELNDDTGKAVVVTAEIDDSLRPAVEDAARGCPVHAITLEGV